MQGQYSRTRSNNGFTLIELIIAVVILGILMAIALPSYQRQVLKGHRSAALSEIMEIANREHQFLLANRAFTNDPNDFGYTLPSNVDARYTPTITVDNTGVPSFTITFTAKGPQVKDGGPIVLNSEGEKSPANFWD